MADHGILESLGKKGILSSLMESPLYFTMQLRERLKLIQQFGGQVSAIEQKRFHRVGEDWIFLLISL